MKIVKLVGAALIAASVLVFISSNQFEGFYEDFEKLPLQDSIKINTSGTTTKRGEYEFGNFYGRNSVASVLNSTNKFSPPHRAEVYLDIENYYNENDEIWIGFKFLVPNIDYLVDSENNNRGVVIFQIHSKPEKGSSWKDYQKNLPFNRPSIALHLRKKEDKYSLFLMYGLNGKEDTRFSNEKWTKVGEQVIEPDRWHDLLFNYKLSFNDDGFIRAWINERSLTPKTETDNKVFGPNMHTTTKPYMKMGLYRYWTDNHIHKIYFDDLIVSSNEEEITSFFETIK